MNVLNSSLLAAVATLLTAGASVAHAQVRITEIAPWGSASTTPYQTDWFELTNFGDATVDLTGWSMDDSSNGSAKVALSGISSIAAGETVIFTETAATASFLSTWFGDQAPAGLQIGNYTGKGVGLSQSGDAVNIYNASGDLHAEAAYVVFAFFDVFQQRSVVFVSELDRFHSSSPCVPGGRTALRRALQISF